MSERLDEVVRAQKALNRVLIEVIKEMQCFLGLTGLFRQAKVQKLAFHLKEFPLTVRLFVCLLKSIDLFEKFKAHMHLVAESSFVVLACMIGLGFPRNGCYEGGQGVPRGVVDEMGHVMEGNQLSCEIELLGLDFDMLDYLGFFFTKLVHLRDDDLEEKYDADQVKEPIGDEVEDGSWP